jgi:hypothetical protein
MGAPFFAFFAKGGHGADGIKRFLFAESKKRERNHWSGREDLNLRPPGPEPDSAAYGFLLIFVGRKRLMLNEL